jgi:uroporphyrinogen-III synthase
VTSDCSSPHALQGLRVVVTRPPGDAQRLRTLLENAGASIVEFPTISIAEPVSWAEVDASIDRLGAGLYDWVIFTSGNAVERFVRRLSGESAVALGATKIGAVGPVTRAALEARGVRVDSVPHEFTAEALARELPEPAARALLPRAADTPDDMREALTTRGWRVDEIAVYRTIVGGTEPPSTPLVKAGNFDVVTFASASSVRGFVDIAGPPASTGLSASEGSDKTVACIGPVTSRAAGELGMRVDVTPSTHTTAGLVDALVEHFTAGKMGG